MIVQENDGISLTVYEKSLPIFSLLTAELLIKQVNDYKWIWVINTLHHSLYSMCISAIVHGNPDSVLKPNKKGDIVFTRDENRFNILTFNNVTKKNKFGRYALSELIDSKEIENYKVKLNNFSIEELSFNFDYFDKHDLIAFQDALGRVMEGEILLGSFVNNKPLVLTNEELNDIDRIHDLRNKFVHFKPMTYIDHIPSIKKALQTYIKTIEFLLFEISPPIFFDANESEKLKPVIDSIKKNLITECT